MKKMMLVVLLLAMVGTMAFAVVLTRSKATVDKAEQKKESVQKKEVKKRSGCGYYN